MFIQKDHIENINKDVAHWAISYGHRHYAEYETLTSIHSLFLFQSLLYFPLLLDLGFSNGIRLIQELTFIDPWPIFSHCF